MEAQARGAARHRGVADDGEVVAWAAEVPLHVPGSAQLDDGIPVANQNVQRVVVFAIQDQAIAVRPLAESGDAVARIHVVADPLGWDAGVVEEAEDAIIDRLFGLLGHAADDVRGEIFRELWQPDVLLVLVREEDEVAIVALFEVVVGLECARACMGKLCDDLPCHACYLLRHYLLVFASIGK